MNELLQIGPISPLRQRLIDDMAVRRFTPETQRGYLRDVGRFATWPGRFPHTATAEDIPSMVADDHHVVVSAASRAWADGLARCGRYEEAMPLIARAVERAQSFGGTFDLPELLRIQGLVLNSIPGADPPIAEAALIRSRKLAQSQAALGWELRSATTLARIWIEQGKTSKAQRLLLPVQQRFTEGFGFPDLGTSAELIERLVAA